MPIRDWVSVVVSCLSLFCVFRVHIFTFELDASAFICIEWIEVNHDEDS